MKTYSIRSGYHLPLKGEAQEIVKEAPSSNSYSVRPTEFYYVKPKLHVGEGDSVKIGSPLFFDKRQPSVIFVSPVAGTIREIQYGERRVIQRIIIEKSGESAEQFPSFRPGEIFSAGKEKIKELLLKGGLWPSIRQRPFDIIASPQKKPDAIFVNAMDTSPLAIDPEFSLKDKKADLKAGIDALRVFSSEVHLSIGKKDSLFLDTKNVSVHYFHGIHPAGLVSTHIRHISPLHESKVVWYLNVRDVVNIGSFLLVGQYPTERIVGLVGMGLKERNYFKTRVGASLEGILKHSMEKGKPRIISGNVLTGKKIKYQDSVGFYDDLVSVIPSVNDPQFLGWMMPGLRKSSWSRAFLSALLPQSLYSMDTSLNGEERSLVKTGDYEKVMALDILPSFLVKAILSEDIELMEQLGIYEVAPEDFALCSYICPSKTEFTEILRTGLDMMLAEVS